MLREGLCIHYLYSACPGSPYEPPGILGEEIWGKVYGYVAASVVARPLCCPPGTIINLILASASQIAIVHNSNHHVVPPTSKNFAAVYPEVRESTKSSFPNPTLGAQLRSYFRSKPDSHRDRLCSWNVRLIYYVCIFDGSD